MPSCHSDNWTEGYNEALIESQKVMRKTIDVMKALALYRKLRIQWKAQTYIKLKGFCPSLFTQTSFLVNTKAYPLILAGITP